MSYNAKLNTIVKLGIQAQIEEKAGHKENAKLTYQKMFGKQLLLARQIRETHNNIEDKFAIDQYITAIEYAIKGELGQDAYKIIGQIQNFFQLNAEYLQKIEEKVKILMERGFPPPN